MENRKAKRLLWGLIALVCLWGIYRTPDFATRFWPGLFWSATLDEAKHYADARRDRVGKTQAELAEKAKDLMLMPQGDEKRGPQILSILRSEAALACYRHYARLAKAKLMEMTGLAKSGDKAGLRCPFRP